MSNSASIRIRSADTIILSNWHLMQSISIYLVLISAYLQSFLISVNVMKHKTKNRRQHVASAIEMLYLLSEDLRHVTNTLIAIHIYAWSFSQISQSKHCQVVLILRQYCRDVKRRRVKGRTRVDSKVRKLQLMATVNCRIVAAQKIICQHSADNRCISSLTYQNCTSASFTGQ